MQLFSPYLLQHSLFSVLVVVIGTMAGAFAGYLIGRYLWFKPSGEFTGMVSFLFNNIPGFSVEIYEKVHTLFVKWDFWILGAATATPLPYGMFSVASGVFQINIFTFLITTLLSQGTKFIFLGFLTSKIGPKIRKLLEFDLKPLAIISTICILITFAVSNFLSQFLP
jgi:membrane protein YqaA with SNARE-associated domain